MTWDVPTAEDCPYCGQTLFKKSGKGQKKTFCINESCENFTPEELRGGYRKKKPTEGGAGETPEAQTSQSQEAPKKTKKAAPKKTAAKTSSKKPKKPASQKAAAGAES